MKVSSTVYPESREYLQGKVLVNFNVTSEEKDGTVMYTYEQLRFELWYSDEAIEKEVAKRKEELKVKSITPLQARLQINVLGLREQVEEVVTVNQDIQDYWEYATVIERNHPLLIELATAVGLTEEQLDDAFTAASKL